MGNFQTWLNEADIPTKTQDGTWVDLETGIQYDPNFDYQKKAKTENQRKKPSCETLNYREYAKLFGGKALTGTQKQKNWAEKIRNSFLTASRVSDEDAHLLCYLTVFETAKFWINNRELSAEQLVKAANKSAILIKKLNLLALKINKADEKKEQKEILELFKEREPLLDELTKIFK